MTAASAPAPTTPAWTRGVRLPLLLLLVVLLVRAQTLGNPVIQLDEQLYRLIGERMLQGAIPFVDVWDTKPVGLFLMFALAALIGGTHALSYQIMAALCVMLAAWAIHAMARRLCEGSFAPIVAALLYIFWLNLLQGEGGQSSVIYTAPVAGAALIVLRHVTGERPGQHVLLRDGALAMLLIGFAIQLKYTVAVEGIYFGLALLWSGWRDRIGLARLLAFGALWAAIALLPTLLAWGAYVAMGQSDAWFFANFVSVSLRYRPPLYDLLEDVAGGLGSIALLFVAAGFGWWRRPRGNPAMLFVAGWAIAATAALLAVRSFSPHYWIPLVPPFVLLAVPALATMRRSAIALAIMGAFASQALVAYLIYSKGNARTMEHMVAAIGPVPNCLFVFDGYPALYQETRSCLPSRFLFPNMLNGAQLAGALGVDPAVEVERIFANKPDAVVTDWPLWVLRNRETTAIVDRELAAHYRLVLREETGKGRFRLVYRRKPEPEGR